MSVILGTMYLLGWRGHSRHAEVTSLSSFWLPNTPPMSEASREAGARVADHRKCLARSNKTREGARRHRWRARIACDLPSAAPICSRGTRASRFSDWGTNKAMLEASALKPAGAAPRCRDRNESGQKNQEDSAACR